MKIQLSILSVFSKGFLGSHPLVGTAFWGPYPFWGPHPFPGPAGRLGWVLGTGSHTPSLQPLTHLTHHPFISPLDAVLGAVETERSDPRSLPIGS